MEFIREPRGLRNNNPGNIRHGSAWKGLAERQNDKEFCQFVACEYGLRAMHRLLATYHRKYALCSVHEVIHRWAPSSENATKNYIKAVITYMNSFLMMPITSLDDISDREYTPLLIAAIIQFENGFNPFSHDYIAACKNVE